MKYLLFNEETNNKNYKEEFDSIKESFENNTVINAKGLDYKEFLKGLNQEDEVVLFGGDGTLNYFVNAIDGYELNNNVYLSPASIAVIPSNRSCSFFLIACTPSGLDKFVLFPNWPNELSPIAYANPSVVKNTLWSSPSSIILTVPTNASLSSVSISYTDPSAFT